MAGRLTMLQDGYAVLSTDGPGEYDIAFEAFAGVAPRTLTPGTVAYIGTGGPLPEGADAGLPAGRLLGSLRGAGCAARLGAQQAWRVALVCPLAAHQAFLKIWGPGR